ncbi:putative disease resistance protein, partial [Tanacetum coccineum]
PISEWGPQNFPTSLVRLELWGGWLEDVNSCSQLSHLLSSSLTSLFINEFKKLESLSAGLQHLTSLEHLFIYNCPKVIHLPEMLLPSLLSLRIYDCPNLKEKCSTRGAFVSPMQFKLVIRLIGSSVNNKHFLLYSALVNASRTHSKPNGVEYYKAIASAYSY